MSENWIQTDEAADVAGSIRHAIRAANSTAHDPLAWKWVVLALHSALQGACVCHLATTAPPIGAVTPKNAVQWLDYHERSRSDPKAKPPKTYLMALPDLLKSVRKPCSAGDRSNVEGVSLNDSELAWLSGFHEIIRNQFVHFEPMGWSIEISGIPKIARLVARIVRDILNLGWAFRHLGFEEREDFYESLRQLEDITIPPPLANS